MSALRRGSLERLEGRRKPEMYDCGHVRPACSLYMLPDTTGPDTSSRLSTHQNYKKIFPHADSAGGGNLVRDTLSRLGGCIASRGPLPQPLQPLPPLLTGISDHVEVYVHTSTRTWSKWADEASDFSFSASHHPHAIVLTILL